MIFLLIHEFNGYKSRQSYGILTSNQVIYLFKIPPCPCNNSEGSLSNIVDQDDCANKVKLFRIYLFPLLNNFSSGILVSSSLLKNCMEIKVIMAPELMPSSNTAIVAVTGVKCSPNQPCVCI